MYRFSSRSAESTGLTRRATEAPASVLYSTLRRPIERNTVRTSDFRDAVENLCMIRAKHNAGSMDECGTAVDNFGLGRERVKELDKHKMLEGRVDWEDMVRIRHQQNRFSVLLSLLRRHLTARRYQKLLRMHTCSRQLFRGSSGPDQLQRLWIQVMEGELDETFEELDNGELSYLRFRRFSHLYRDLLLNG